MQARRRWSCAPSIRRSTSAMTSRTCISLVLAIALAAAAHAAEPPRISSATDVTAAGLVEIRTLSPVAKALAAVEADLRAQGFGLRLYDCYRPVRAVQAFMAWVSDPQEQSRKALQYPDLDKPQLL